jgi:uncharacterized protein
VKMSRVHFEVGETAVTIIGDDPFIPAAREAIFHCRELIQGYIHQDPFFRETLEPYQPKNDAPSLIRRMCEASSKAGVGPMACVAGLIAEEAVRAMVEEGARHAIVDNGGDIAMVLSEPLSVGLYAGTALRGVGFECEPRESVFGICTSSATVGPSLSLGMADAATVIGEDLALIDACATRLGNEISKDDDETVSRALDMITSVERVEGAVVVVGQKVAMKGRLPRLVRLEEVEERVTRLLFTRG